MGKVKPVEEIVLPEFKEGDLVEPIKNVDYKGNQLMRYDSYYVITSLRDDRAILSAKRGNNYYMWAALNVKNLKKVEE